MAPKCDLTTASARESESSRGLHFTGKEIEWWVGLNPGLVRRQR